MDPRSNVEELFGSKGIRIAGIVVLAVLALFLLTKTVALVDTLGRTDTASLATITVNGTGKVTATPNIAQISFMVQESAPTVVAAQNAATKRTDDALATIKKLGIAEKDIKTNGYNVNPEYATPSCPPGSYCPNTSGKITGYQVSQSIEIRVRDTAKAGDVLQALGTAGVQNVSGPNFMIDDTSAVTAEARGKAIADARAKADVLARQLGVHLGKVVGFSENGGNVYPMYAGGMAKSATMDSVAPAPTLPVGENDTTANVTVIYEVR